MLVLTCRIGDTLRIDHAIQMILRARLRERITVDVLAPPDAELHFAGACLQPLVLPSGTRSYLFSLQGVRRFQVADVEIGIWLPGEEVVQASACDDYIHVGLLGPRPMRVGYEQARTQATPISTAGRSLAPSNLH